MAGHLRYTAILDACVLYGMLKTDVMLTLSSRGLFAAKWSERIDEEWTRNLIADKPGMEEAVARRLSAMHNASPDWAVDAVAIQALEASLELPDPDDRHVLAAAIIGHADCIVTENHKDFPEAVVSKFGIEVIAPDVFIINQLDLNEYDALAALKSLRLRWRRPEATTEDFCAAFERNGLLLTASRLRDRIELI